MSSPVLHSWVGRADGCRVCQAVVGTFPRRFTGVSVMDAVLVLSSGKWDRSATFPFFSTQDHLSRICALFNYFPNCLTHTQPNWAVLLHLQCLCGFHSVHQSPISSLQAQTVRAPWVQRPQVEEQVLEFRLNAGLIIELSSDP